MRLRPYFHFFVIVGLALYLTQCASPRRPGLQGVNIAYMYQVDGQVVRSDFALKRTKADSAFVYFSFHSDDILFMRNEDGVMSGSMHYSFRLLRGVDQKTAVDTGVYKVDNILSSGKRIVGKFGISLVNLAPGNDDAILMIQATDVNRNFTMVSFLRVQNTHSEQSQNWMISKGDRALMSVYAKIGDTLMIRHRQGANDHYFVEFFADQFGLALPPFSQRENLERSSMISDTSFYHSPDKPLLVTQPGMYHIRLSRGSAYGTTIYAVESNYPLVTRKNELIGPMRYITTKREYEDLTSSDDPDEIKKSVDRFWLQRGRSVEKSRNLISAFYGRVEKANVLFSSYKEGWKTDRGVIFTIFGPPNLVTPTKAGERWVYGDENSHLTYIFNFVRVDNPFSENDYELIRDESYRYGWGVAIEAWRMGKVYNVKDIKREQDERDQQIRLRQQPAFWY